MEIPKTPHVKVWPPRARKQFIEEWRKRREKEARSLQLTPQQKSMLNDYSLVGSLMPCQQVKVRP